MTSEQTTERKPLSPQIIEFCGTPYAARLKLILDHALTHMILERTGMEHLEEHCGISPFGWGGLVNSNSRLEYFEQITNVQRMLASNQRFLPIQDGAFAALTLTEIHRRTGVLKPDEAENLKKGLLPYVQMESLIVLTLVRPRAAMSRDLFPPDIEGYRQLMEEKFVLYSVYNDSARQVLQDFRKDLPKVELLDFPEDNFQRDEIFFQNADTVLQFLGLPTIEEWSEEITKHPEKRRPARGVISTRTLSGKTTAEIKKELKGWDWSQNPKKRSEFQDNFMKIITELTTRGIIPPTSKFEE